VFGGVRREPDGAALARDSGGAVRPLILDVTEQPSLDAARKAVDAAIGPDDDFSLVNNAGITVAGPLELLAPSDLRRQFDVNLFGHVAATRTFLPLLRSHRGRILFMGSLFSRISLPFVAPYSASKAALAALAGSLSLELRAWGIPVVLVEPGNIATPIWSRTHRDVVESLPRFDAGQLALYRRALESFERLTNGYASGGIGPERVARVVTRALSKRRPRLRYPVGWDSRIFGGIAPILPARFRQWILARVTLRR
jgi:NAD(P)-dependent dehydrogenase (short-subunit alcohol dehydrogenase family)